jgi:hypothetical protein
MSPVFLDLTFCEEYLDKANATPEQKEELVLLARKTLDYVLQHKEDWNPELLDVQAGVRGLKRILTQPEDVRKLQELLDYFSQVERKTPVQN